LNSDGQKMLIRLPVNVRDQGVADESPSKQQAIRAKRGGWTRV
jgi:hypothetical protein